MTAWWNHLSAPTQPPPAAIGADETVFETGDRVCYVELEYNVDEPTGFVDVQTVVHENDQGLVTRIINEESVMVLWLNNDEVSAHHVSVLTLVNSLRDVFLAQRLPNS